MTKTPERRFRIGMAILPFSRTTLWDGWNVSLSPSFNILEKPCSVTVNTVIGNKDRDDPHQEATENADTNKREKEVHNVQHKEDSCPDIIRSVEKPDDRKEERQNEPQGFTLTL
jgi:hypothetical protein